MTALYHIVEKTVTDSTNDDARALITEGASDNTIIIAEEQTKGRGRQAREWVSQKGNLFCSFVVFPKQEVKDFPLYSFVMALGVRDAVQEFLPGKKVQVKWPNDVLVEGKKISGLLLEVEGNALIVGVGVNCALAPEETLFPSTSLAGEGTTVAPKELLDALCCAFTRWRSLFDAQGFAPIRQEWKNHCWRWQQEIEIRQEKTILHGKLIDLAEDGALILGMKEAAVRITAGDVWN